MAGLLNFPLDKSQLSDRLMIESNRRRLTGFQDISTSGAGDIIVADIAPRAWTGSVESTVMTFQQAAEVEALINSLDESQNSFYLGDPRAPYPFYDPDGTILNGMGGTIKINDISSDNLRIQIKNAPVGFKFQRGVFFHFDFGTDPVHRAYHQIVSNQEVADGFGVTDWIEVRPRIRNGAAVNDVLTFANPCVEVKIIPGSYREGVGQGMVVTGIGFDWRQVI